MTTNRVMRRVAIVVCMSALAAGLLPLGPARAAGMSCTLHSGGTNSVDAEAWFTDTENGTVDSLLKYNPNNPGTKFSITSPASPKRGFIVQGWLHICTSLNGWGGNNFAGKVNFRDSGTVQPNWNSHDNQDRALQAAEDRIVAEFFQEISTSGASPDYFRLTPKIDHGSCSTACASGKDFEIDYSGDQITPPTPDTSGSNGTCNGSGYAADMYHVVIKQDLNHANDVSISSGAHVYVGDQLNGNVEVCLKSGAPSQQYVAAVRLLTPSGSITADWEDQAYTDTLTTTGTWYIEAGWYQNVPNETIGAAYHLYPRLFADTTSNMDDSSAMLAQGDFVFYPCTPLNPPTCN